jgi:hypothetical protein
VPTRLNQLLKLGLLRDEIGLGKKNALATAVTNYVRHPSCDLGIARDRGKPRDLSLSYVARDRGNTHDPGNTRDQA